MSETNTRQAKRTPVTLKIKFKSATLDQFIERYSVDISHGGIFIRTKDPLPVGTNLRFEFQLRDASPLITGDGTVVWTREHDPSRVGVAPGMGVRFDRLTPKSKSILDQILSQKASKSGNKDGSFEQGPTRVASSMVIADLAERATGDSFSDDGSDSTPLPAPVPFHSDADDFPEEAFEQATKVTALDDLVAQTADSSTGDSGGAGAKANGKAASRVRTKSPSSAPPNEEGGTRIGHEPGKQTASKEAEELAHRKEELAKKKAEAHARKVKTVVEAAKDPRKQAVKQRLLSKQMALATEKGDVNPEDLVEVQQSSKPRGGLWIAVGLLMLGAAGIGGWMFLTKQREPGPSGDTVVKTEVAPSTRPVIAPTTNIGVGEGSATTMVTTKPEGATVEIVNSSEKGESPYEFKGLASDKTYSVRVSLNAYVTDNIDIRGGAKEPVTVTLKPLPRKIILTSTPSKALVKIDDTELGTTPLTLPLIGGLAAAESFDLFVSKEGYVPGLHTVVVHEDFEVEAGVAVLKHNEELILAEVAQTTTTDTTPASTTTTTTKTRLKGKGKTGGTTTTTTTTTTTGTTTTAAVPPPPPPPPPTKGGAEPVPDWMK